jgi:mono/diheme cytochrome c family protein
MKGWRELSVTGLLAVVVLVGFLANEATSGSAGGDDDRESLTKFDRLINANSRQMVREGRRAFRSDTFGDEAFWGDLLGLHNAIQGTAFGGVATPDLKIDGVSPKTALAVGLKVDVEALPRDLLNALRRGQVNLDDPATTLALLRLNAVVGLTGFFQSGGSLKSIGIQCALCHSTVDNAFAPGIGRRLDGWANRDLDIGLIASLAPNLQPVADLLSLAGPPVDVAAVKRVLRSWGPGKFDAALLLDGKSAPTLIPPAFGLAGVNLHTWTGWGSVTHWNAFVANLEMHGKGTFFDPRLNDESQFPIAARAGFGNVRNTPDLITPILAALQFYQLAIPAPAPPKGSFDRAAAARGRQIFEGSGRCATCHVPPLFTEPGWNMHTAAEIGIDDLQANRSPDRHYRTSPLKGLWTHQKGGFYHDGRFATLLDVVNHYNRFFGLGLMDGEKRDLAEYLKSL